MRHAVLIMTVLLFGSTCPWVAAPLFAEEAAAKPTVRVQTASELTTEELAAILGAHVWKFDVRLPDTAHEVHVALRCQTKGQAAQQLGAGLDTLAPRATQGRVMVALVPIGGTITDANQVRVTIDGFGSIASAIADNPLRGMAVGKSQSLEANDDGTVTLIGGYLGGRVTTPTSTAHTVVFLVVEPRLKN
jgi:hypothetical protein